MASLSPPDLPSTSERPAIQPIRPSRPFGVRLWLALMFAAIGILTGTSVYLFVSESSQSAAEERATQLAQGRALDLASDLGITPQGEAGQVVAQYRSDSFAAWVFDPNNEILAATTEYTVTKALERWMGDEIFVESVDVSNNATNPGIPESEFHIEVAYIRRDRLERGAVKIAF